MAVRILNFGSLNLDYVYTVDHLVRPGETIRSSKREPFCGGKGLNQSVALARAGASVSHAGMIGKEGTMLIDLLQRAGVDCQFIQTVEDSTGHAIIQVDRNGENCILLYGGANRAITPQYVDEVLSQFDKGDVILLQNEISCLDYIIQRAHSRRMKIVLNPSPFEESLLELPLEYIDYFLVNEVEGYQFSGETDPISIACKLNQDYHAAVVLTLGKEGAVYLDEAGWVCHGVYEAEVVDTTGAGDTFTGYFLYEIFSGSTPEKALDVASMASSITISRAGAAVSIPAMKEVVEKLQEERKKANG